MERGILKQRVEALPEVPVPRYRREFGEIWRALQQLPTFEKKYVMSGRGRFIYRAPYED